MSDYFTNNPIWKYC